MLCPRNGLNITLALQKKGFQLFWQSKKKTRDETNICPRENKSIIYLFLFDRTSNLGIEGHADSTDPIVGYRCHLSCTSCSMPGEEGEQDSVRGMFKGNYLSL